MTAHVIAGMLLSGATNAMEFRLSDLTIYAFGPINPGDAGRLSQLVEDNHKLAGVGDYTIRLNSPGGNLVEGIKIGEIIRRHQIETLVARGDSCASACALAFLGGTRRYATGLGPGRNLEFAASLGFHGFSLTEDTLNLANGTLQVARVINGVILEYAAAMGDVDLGWLAQALTVEPRKLLQVNTPAAISALSITLHGLPSAIPDDWHLNACRQVVNVSRPTLDLIPDRVLARSEKIQTVRAIREMVVATRFPNGVVARFVTTLSDSDAIDLALGNPFYLDTRKPILEARKVDLDRGRGFYFDVCLAVRFGHDISILLLDQVSGLISRRDFSETTRISYLLAARPSDTAMW